jgi:hypothetical protein
MYRRGDPVDGLLLAGELERLGALASVGGKARLSELAALVPAASNVGHYASLVVEAAQQRSLYSAAVAIENAQANGGLGTHPELIDQMQAAIDAARVLPGEPGIPEGPVFIDVHDFIEREVTNPDPLLGTEERAILARGGLGILAGRPGTGKTTLVLDMACHLAAGKPWPPQDESERAPAPWNCPNPLRIAIIVNEGPESMFQAKLEDKIRRFPHSLRDAGGKIVVQAWRWGAFSFADRDAFRRAQEQLHEEDIDLVIGDPLLTLGPEGVGSPRETSDFVQLLVPLGLKSHRAFLFLHHFRERTDKDEDELGRLSGAWGGHLDTLITLSAHAKKDHLRLAYPKLRWWRGAATPEPIILGKVYVTQSFEALAEEHDATLLEPLIVEHLVGRRKDQADPKKAWSTAEEIRSGLKVRAIDVKKALEGAPHLFVSVTGAAAKELGRAPKAILWGLEEWVGDTEPSEDLADTESSEDFAADQGSFEDEPPPDPTDDGIPF